MISVNPAVKEFVSNFIIKRHLVFFETKYDLDKSID